jgi:hypothetical protein
MRTREELDAELGRRRAELITAEDCPEHRTVAEIRAELAIVMHQRDELELPRQRVPD